METLTNGHLTISPHGFCMGGFLAGASQQLNLTAARLNASLGDSHQGHLYLGKWEVKHLSWVMTIKTHYILCSPTSFVVELKPFAKVTSGGHINLHFDPGKPSDEWMSNLLFKDLSKWRTHRFPFPRAIQLEKSSFSRS